MTKRRAKNSGNRLPSRVGRFREDYKALTSAPFNHFYCPILFEDQDTELCQAHIVPEGFRNTTRKWAVQRKDVDNFFGSNFESDFLSLQYNDNPDPIKSLTNRTLSNVLKPTVRIDGQAVGYYQPKGQVPSDHAQIDLHDNGQVFPMVFKIAPDKIHTNTKIEVEIKKDLRLPAIVSAIKAAHLTLFELLGYRYALSAGGQFVGRQILGAFYRQSVAKQKPMVVSEGLLHFQQFSGMVRPVVLNGVNFQGSITDGRMMICDQPSHVPWAIIVFIRTAESFHAVLMPVLDRIDSPVRFVELLRNKLPSFEGTIAQFDGEQWHTSNTVELAWPTQVDIS
jgi:hypothetical protein